MFLFQIALLIFLTHKLFGQTLNISTEPKIKISNQPFAASNIEQLKIIEWTMLGKTASQTIYCVSEKPITKLYFICPECVKKNYTDIIDVLKTAEDLTKMSGFPTIALQNVPAKSNWTGINIICQGRVQNKTFNSLPAKVVVQYIRQPYIIDGNNFKSDLNSKHENRFYVNCHKNEDGKCIEFSNEKNILKCVVEGYPRPTIFKWYKNGIEMSETSPIINLNNDMIGQSIQCAANNGLHRENDMPESQAIQIFPFITPKIVDNNFINVENSRLLQPGNRINMRQSIVLSCDVEANPKPQIFWKHRKLNGEIVDALCLKELNYSENIMYINNAVRVKSTCMLTASDYSSSGQYWCTGCSYTSKKLSNCSTKHIEVPNNYFNMEVQGLPIISNEKLVIKKINNGKDILISVNYCSNPKPLLSKEVVFVVNQHVIQEGQKWSNFRFTKIKQNDTVSICYSASMIIYREGNFDKNTKIMFIVYNTFGKVNINIPLNFDFDINNYDIIIKLTKYGIIIFSILFTICLLIVLYIKNYVFHIKKNTNAKNKEYNSNDNKRNDKEDKKNIPGIVVNQNISEIKLSNNMNFPMIDETLIYEDYVDFKIYGTLKKQPVFLSQEAFV